jgi:starch phosphorylase
MGKTASQVAQAGHFSLRPIHTFKVRPRLPEPLKPLLQVAYNLRWSWDHGVIELFRRLDPDLWERSGHNPVFLLGNVDQDTLEAAARDEGFLAHLDGVVKGLDNYLAGEAAWYPRMRRQDAPLIAYFSAEFGITECLSIFAGGLGVLAGDHLKAASDLGVPLLGVGLLYQQGYFSQYLNAAGWQQEAYEDNDFHALPIERVPDITVQINLAEGPVTAQVWRAAVGRLQLYLLDTNIPQNEPFGRQITNQLYGGGLEMRLKQEILLGIGGYRALEAMGLEPTVCHMNEGHSAFLGLERVRRFMETRHLTFQEARVLASASLIFTTHTPVAAGHDYFPPSLMDRYFYTYPGILGISREEFLGLGRQNPNNNSEDFCMTVLALRLAAFSNGVSKLHGEVTRHMWSNIWPGLPEPEIPIGHVTNGVHFRTWVSYEMNQLYDRYLGPKWREEPTDPKLWRHIASISTEELWRTHERRRERLVANSRRRLHEQLVRRGSPQADIDAAEEALSPEVLTIGFGRRFAAYKRAMLLLRQPERLARLLNDPKQPVQVIYAGKAHPNDAPGKELIQAIVNLARQPEFRHRLVFIEDYNMDIARYMVQGCDVWLNTPLRPLEASGTSGMKALANGVLNVSTLDGWWDEAWRLAPDGAGPNVGWAIGRGETYDNQQEQDEVEADALYELLERDIIPTFYDRSVDGVPRQWVARMKASLTALCPEFNMHRLVKQYTEDYYEAAHTRFRALDKDNAAQAKELAGWLRSVQEAWPHLRIESVDPVGAELLMGSDLNVRASVALGRLRPQDVSVEAVVGRVDAQGEIVDSVATPMQAIGETAPGVYQFEIEVRPPSRSGMHGLAIRVLPHHPALITPYIPGLIAWANSR